MKMKFEVLKQLFSPIVGEKNFLIDEESLLSHSKDCWPLMLLQKRQGKILYRPDAVLLPSSTAELQEICRLATKERIALIPFGGGSGVCGGTVPVKGGITVDLKRMNQFCGLDSTSLIAEAQAGINGEQLDNLLEQKGVTMGHYPASIAMSTLGGWVMTRASGQLSTKYGSIEDIVVALEVVLPDGTKLVTNIVPRSATGPDWKHLFLGSEGNLGFVTKIWFKVSLLPDCRIFASYLFPSFERGSEAVRQILQSGIYPAVVRLYDETDTLLTSQALGEALQGVLLILTFEGKDRLVQAEYELAAENCMKLGATSLGKAPAEHWWKNRYEINKYLDILMRKDRMILDTIDVSACWVNLSQLYQKMRNAIAGVNSNIQVLAHLSHAYTEGASLYFSFFGQVEEEEATYLEIWRKAMEACLEAGGAISHHHGVGLLRAPWMKPYLGETLLLFQAIKHALDSAGIMNPGKMGL